MEMFVTIEPHGIYFLSNFAYTHIQTLSCHRYTILVANTDSIKYSYSQPCMHSICELLNARPEGVQLNRCVSQSVRGHLVKMLLTLETLYILHQSAGNDQLGFHTGY